MLHYLAGGCKRRDLYFRFQPHVDQPSPVRDPKRRSCRQSSELVVANGIIPSVSLHSVSDKDKGQLAFVLPQCFRSKLLVPVWLFAPMNYLSM